MKRGFMKRQILSSVALSMCLGLSSCGGPSSEVSSPKTVNIPYTPVEKQSLGNCWNFGLAGWVEALVLKEQNETINLSESYFLYRHLENQLKRKSTLRVQGAAYWAEAISLLLNHGVLEEQYFIASEVETERSDIQAEALKTINESLKDGILKTDRSDSTIHAELDRAFGVVRSEFEQKVVSAQDFYVNQEEATLYDTINAWRALDWEKLTSSQSPSRDAEMPQAYSLTPAHQLTLKSVKMALNDGYPVLVFINSAKDFYDSKTGIYNIEPGMVQKRKAAGHMALIKDYTTSGVDPSTGLEFSTGEGELSEADQELALQYGTVESFVLKNSWGQSSGYEYLGTKGHLRLNKSYLNSWVKGRFFPQTTVQQFFIPKKYLQQMN